LDWSATLGYQYTSSQQLTPFNNSLYDTLDSYDRWDLRINISDAELTWEVTAFVQNISDDRDEIFRPRPSPVSGLAASTLSDPRTYGLKLTYNF
jgi:outer membrane receptor protein involved in Fe transport